MATVVALAAAARLYFRATGHEAEAAEGALGDPSKVLTAEGMGHTEEVAQREAELTDAAEDASPTTAST